MSEDRSSPGLGEGGQARGGSDVRLTLPARPENVAVVRHVLGAFAEALRRHAYADGEPGPVEILIRPEGNTLMVMVSDRGRGLGPSADSSGTGLGLPLIAALSHSFEIEQVPDNGARLRMAFLRGAELEPA